MKVDGTLVLLVVLLILVPLVAYYPTDVEVVQEDIEPELPDTVIEDEPSDLTSMQHCEQDSDCEIKYYDFCCMQEVRYLQGCFHRDSEPVRNLDCTEAETCMKTGEPLYCFCQNNRCAGLFDPPRDFKITIGAKI